MGWPKGKKRTPKTPVTEIKQTDNDLVIDLAMHLQEICGIPGCTYRIHLNDARAILVYIEDKKGIRLL